MRYAAITLAFAAVAAGAVIANSTGRVTLAAASISNDVVAGPFDVLQRRADAFISIAEDAGRSKPGGISVFHLDTSGIATKFIDPASDRAVDAGVVPRLFESGNRICIAYSDLESRVFTKCLNETQTSWIEHAPVFTPRGPEVMVDLSSVSSVTYVMLLNIRTRDVRIIETTADGWRPVKRSLHGRGQFAAFLRYDRKSDSRTPPPIMREIQDRVRRSKGEFSFQSIGPARKSKLPNSFNAKYPGFIAPPVLRSNGRWWMNTLYTRKGGNFENRLMSFRARQWHQVKVPQNRSRRVSSQGVLSSDPYGNLWLTWESDWGSLTRSTAAVYVAKISERTSRVLRPVKLWQGRFGWPPETGIVRGGSKVFALINRPVDTSSFVSRVFLHPIDKSASPFMLRLPSD